MRKPGGYAYTFDASGIQQEADTFTCEHCNRIVHVKPGAIPDELGSMCRNCMKMVCPTCAPGPCVPWLKQIEIAERRERTLRSYES